MANLNYNGSLAQEKMKFRSVTSVVVNNSNELFNAMSIYVPKRFASQNIVDWSDSYLTPNRPAVFTAVVDNYAKIIKGDLLTQWQPVFRDDSNSDVVLYIIVFDDEQSDQWEITDATIEYGPLSKAFNALYAFSYFKFMFDPDFNGQPVDIPASSGSNAVISAYLRNDTANGTKAVVNIRATNSGDEAVTIPAGTYSFNDGNKTYSFTTAEKEVASGAHEDFDGLTANTVGADSYLEADKDITSIVDPAIAGVTVTIRSFTQGINAGSGQSVTVPAGTYAYTDGGKTFNLIVDESAAIAVGDSSAVIDMPATTIGLDSQLPTVGALDISKFSPALPAGIAAVCTEVTQGSEAREAQEGVPSMYWDLSLALANLCKNNVQLSWMWTQVNVSYDADNKPNSSDKCWIIYQTRAQQLTAMQSLRTGDRARYFWAALYLMDAQNTTVICHSEHVNVYTQVLKEWFGKRNGSGQYIGNKMSLLRLDGTKIKPLGFPSWLDASVNENDAAHHQQLDDMNVGYLATISDNTTQNCYLSMARGVGDVDAGKPCAMQMIAKFVDYTCSMQAANMVTDKGTLTAPKLTDEESYAAIQRLVRTNLSLFAGTNGRLYGVTLEFPPFSEAKKGRTMLSAPNSWSAIYKDDLDEVEVSGSIAAV